MPLSPEEQRHIEELQSRIDSGAAWSLGHETVELCISLLDAGLCTPPPSVQRLLLAPAAADHSEVQRWQVMIDTRTAFEQRHLGYFALCLIRAGVCRHAPGVIGVWTREDDGRYELIYTPEEWDRRIVDATQRLSTSLPGLKAKKRYLELCEKHSDEIRAALVDGVLDFSWGKLVRTFVTGRDAFVASADRRGEVVYRKLWEQACRDVGVDPNAYERPK